MAGISLREKNEKFVCEKFTARNRVREMREICNNSLGLNWPILL